MSKKIILPVILVVIALGIWLFLDNTNSEPTNLKTESNPISFNTPKKSAHYETNTPAHGSVLAAAPINIVIDFNFDLAPPSSISIIKDDVEYGVGDLQIDSDKLAMRRNFNPAAPNGLYKVNYTACWPDRSCHEGHFEFAIDHFLALNYQEINENEVTIKMSELMFKPRDIKIKPGTKVTWVNDEVVEHYVNTDSHPDHTYYPAQNSQALKTGESYTILFTTNGIYPYHCSAHASTMTGNILVSD